MDISAIKVLAFDVGGTVIDWHTGISEQLRDFGQSKGIDADWVTLTEDWRTKALGLALNARTDSLPRGNIDGVHRQVLDDVLKGMDLKGFTKADRDEMTLFWHRIPPWPDAPAGHARLKKKYILSTLTILSVAMITGISRKAPFHWDLVISCEMLDHYKFNPSVYRRCAELTGYRPEQLMMVAAHSLDLDAASKAGFRTALVHRPDEWGKGSTASETAILVDSFSKFGESDPLKEGFSPDIIASDLEDLADRLGT